MTQNTWLITGSSRGFGRALTVAALEASDQVVATARTPAQLDELVERFDDRILAVALDVTDSAAAGSAFEAALGRFGRVDVVVNNAGYANVAPVEVAPEDDFRRQFETNFWGVYNVSKAALPVLKAQGGGTIVQFSSVGGRVGGTAGLGAYQAAKFAVDGLTRVLAAETAQLGLRYLVVEPGGFATDWAGASMEIQAVPEEYQATVGQFASLVRSGRTSAGDPTRAGEILVRVVKQARLPSHLLLGAGRHRWRSTIRAARSPRRPHGRRSPHPPTSMPSTRLNCPTDGNARDDQSPGARRAAASRELAAPSGRRAREAEAALP